jgi:hypothetical protein
VWGSELTKKKLLHYRGDSSEIAPTPSVKLCDSVMVVVVVVVCFQVSRTASAHKLKATRSGLFRILNLHQKNLPGDQQHFVACR